MKLFPIHILIKDLSFMMIYFILMKYNFTNETYLPNSIENFPGAPDMSWLDMLTASLFYNLFPLIISFISYFPIVFLIRKLIPKRIVLRLIITGFFLTLTTPIYYFLAIDWKHNDYYQMNAEIISWD